MLIDFLKDLRAAIEGADWFAVCDIYKKLTGEDVAVPRPSGGKETLLEISRLVKEALGEPKVPSPAAVVPVAPPVPVSARRSHRVSPGDFRIDHSRPSGTQPQAAAAPLAHSGVEVAEIPQEEEGAALPFDDPTNRPRPRQPGRSPYKPAKPVCAGCGQKKEVHPDLVAPRLGDSKHDGKPKFYCDDCRPAAGGSLASAASDE